MKHDIVIPVAHHTTNLTICSKMVKYLVSNKRGCYLEDLIMKGASDTAKLVKLELSSLALLHLLQKSRDPGI